MKAEVKFASSLSGFPFWEVEVMVGSTCHRVDVGLGEMKRRGVAKSLNGSKKVEAWLNSVDGKKYLADKLARKS